MLDYSAFTPQSSKYNRSNEILRKNGIEPILRKGETDSDLSNTNDGKEANVNKTFSETSSHNNDEVNSYLQKIEKNNTYSNSSSCSISEDCDGTQHLNVGHISITINQETSHVSDNSITLKSNNESPILDSNSLENTVKQTTMSPQNTISETISKRYNTSWVGTRLGTSVNLYN